MADVVGAFDGCEQTNRDRHQLADLIETAWPRRAKKCFEFREGLFDRIEVGTVGRKKPEMRPGAFDFGANLGLLVDRQVVKHDDVAGL